MKRKLINTRNMFLRSLLTSALSILPMVVLVFILSLSKLTPISNIESITLAIGCVVMIVGLALFQIGAGNGISKVGEYMGNSLSKQTKLVIVIIFALALGALITCAEPSILIISSQININRYLLIGMIAIGVGIFVAIGVLRIIFGKNLKIWYLMFYAITFVIICILEADPKNWPFLPFIFDAGGITTGSATVPFILALGAGVAVARGGKKCNEDSFGLVGLASIGPIICMAILIMCSKSGFEPYEMTSFTDETIWQRFAQSLFFTSGTSMGSLIEVLLALAPILIIFFIYELIYIKLPKKEIGRLMIGFAFSYVGLAMFLAAVGASMTPVGLKVGTQLAGAKDVIIFVIAFIIGLVTILCEPAVHSLTNQIRDISDGGIKKITVLITLSLGVGIAVLLSAIRTIYKFSIMYYLVPGYAIALLLMIFSPNLFTAIAFDSGGTASGPMSVSFVVPMMIGMTSYKHGISHADYLAGKVPTGHTLSDFAAHYLDTNNMHCLIKGTEFYEESFGVVALIALTPIIAVQILGMISQYKNKKGLRKIRNLQHSPSNAKIINLA